MILLEEQFPATPVAVCQTQGGDAVADRGAAAVFAQLVPDALG